MIKKRNKNVTCLLLSLDQNSVINQEVISETQDEQIKPTVHLAELFLKTNDKMRLGLLVNEEDKKISDSGFLTYFPNTIEIYHYSKGEGFAGISSEIVADPGEVLFISASRALRNDASRAGMQVIPHPSLAEPVLNGKSIIFCELRGPLEILKNLKGLVPCYSQSKEEEDSLVLGIITRECFWKAAKLGLEIHQLPADPALQDLIFVRIDQWDQGTAEKFKDDKIISYYDEMALLALDRDAPNDILNIHGKHGHFWYLMPDTEMLSDSPVKYKDSRSSFVPREVNLIQDIDREIIERIDLPEIRIPELFPSCPMTSAEFDDIVDKYSGKVALDSNGTIESREVRHPDNPRVVNALLKDLRNLGYCAWKQSFTFGGQVCHNVIAELPGQGILRIDPDILEEIMEILRRFPDPRPYKKWLMPLEELLGSEWAHSIKKHEEHPWNMRRIAEIKLGLYPRPIRLCPQAGIGAKVVVVGCHLDSTAAKDGGYNPATDPAPGADDDASGIAGTLAVAKYLKNFQNKLTNTVRFCFFNAEEVGMVGSQAYASFLKSNNVNVKGAICMDMIGYNSDANRIFEVHAGNTNSSIRNSSVPIADQIAISSDQLGQLAPAQIYKGTVASSGANRNIYDGAIGRSDHASFHQQGYPAVVVSEDFFINKPAEPSSDSNPNYHRDSDTNVNSSYGVDIACSVAHAVKELAK